MGWRIRVVHETGYSYSAPVHESYNEVRLTPRTDNRQSVIVSRVETTPPTRSYRYTDYWGTTVTAFDLHAPHKELLVTGTSVVETADALAPARSATWDELAGEAVRDRYTEMLEFTGYVGRDRDLSRAARALQARQGAGRRRARRVPLGARAPGPTSPAPPACTRRRWRPGSSARGCQDFAHLTLLLVREMGVPARYVSGYLLPRANTEVRQTVRGESHAWIEAWTGGWWGYDPTNDLEIGHQHVWVAVGRDYGDVSPMKGIYSGGKAAALDVTVDMTRLA